eukprot:Clim_evm3s158 gene=Clim_evmTU3s158
MSAEVVSGSAAHVATNVITGAIHIVNYQEEALNVTTTSFARSQLFAPGTFDANGYAIAEESQTLTLYLTADQVQCSSAECQQLTIGDTSFEICYSMYGDQSCVPHIPSAGYSPMPTGVTATSVSFVDEEGYESVAIWICTEQDFVTNAYLCPEQIVEDTWDIRGDLGHEYSEFQIINDMPELISVEWRDPMRPSVFYPDFMDITHNGVLGIPAGKSSPVFQLTQITSQCNSVQEYLNITWSQGQGYFLVDIDGGLTDNNTNCTLTFNKNGSRLCLKPNESVNGAMVAQWTRPVAVNVYGTPRVTLVVCTHEVFRKHSGACPGIKSVAGEIMSWGNNITSCENPE